MYVVVLTYLDFYEIKNSALVSWKICGFAISGLAHHRNLRICGLNKRNLRTRIPQKFADLRLGPEFAYLRFAEFKKHLRAHLFSVLKLKENVCNVVHLLIYTWVRGLHPSLCRLYSLPCMGYSHSSQSVISSCKVSLFVKNGEIDWGDPALGCHIETLR